MERMGGEQGLERERSTDPPQEGQSTEVYGDNPWKVALASQPVTNRSENPKLRVIFKAPVTVQALRLQGSDGVAEEIRLILAYLDEESGGFKDLTDSAGEPKVSPSCISCLFGCAGLLQFS